MTDRNLSEVAIILDRSGSMTSIRYDMEGGFQRFIEDRRKDPVRVLVSLYQFDTEYECKYEERDVREVHGLTLEPRGGTALLDAVGRTILRIGDRLRAKPEHMRPDTVIVMVITDGAENSSREFTRTRVREMIQVQEKQFNWKFLYLGADANAFGEAGDFGFSMLRSAQYQHNAVGTKGLFNVVSNGLGEYYSQRIGGNMNADLNLTGAEGVTVGSETSGAIKISSTTDGK